MGRHKTTHKQYVTEKTKRLRDHPIFQEVAIKAAMRDMDDTAEAPLHVELVIIIPESVSATDPTSIDTLNCVTLDTASIESIIYTYVHLRHFRHKVHGKRISCTFRFKPNEKDTSDNERRISFSTVSYLRKDYVMILVDDVLSALYDLVGAKCSLGIIVNTYSHSKVEI